MRKDPSLSDLCGLTQSEMARLLMVGESHYSMFESGKRDLPLAVKQKLTEILVHLKTHETLKLDAATHSDPNKMSIHIMELLKENEYQHVLTSKKVEAMQRKHDKAQRLSQLSGYFKMQKKVEKGKLNYDHPLLTKATKELNRDYGLSILKLQLKLELLAAEKEVLEMRLPKMV